MGGGLIGGELAQEHRRAGGYNYKTMTPSTFGTHPEGTDPKTDFSGESFMDLD